MDTFKAYLDVRKLIAVAKFALKKTATSYSTALQNVRVELVENDQAIFIGSDGHIIMALKTKVTYLQNSVFFHEFSIPAKAILAFKPKKKDPPLIHIKVGRTSTHNMRLSLTYKGITKETDEHDIENGANYPDWRACLSSPTVSEKAETVVFESRLIKKIEDFSKDISTGEDWRITQSDSDFGSIVRFEDFPDAIGKIKGSKYYLSSDYSLPEWI